MTFDQFTKEFVAAEKKVLFTAELVSRGRTHASDIARDVAQLVALCDYASKDGALKEDER